MPIVIFIIVQIINEATKTKAMIDAIMSAAKTGQIGDGKILVSELEEVYRIRTGENGIDALAEFI